VQVLSQQRTWLDRRHLNTLAWMMVGRVPSQWIRLTAWAPSVHSRAVWAHSRVRRCARWRDHPRLDVPQLSGPRMPQALAEGGTTVRY
jgi:hypothetical protein